MSFKDIRGQDEAVLLLKNSIIGNRVSHAYIFFGPQGVGKKTAAANFAKALNCASGSGGDSCGECISCKKIDSLNHPDVSYISCEKGDSSIGIDKIRQMINSIALKPYEGRKKVFVLDDADLMSQQASNAILKTLEEPPDDSILILLSEDKTALLATIVSRAQMVKFFTLPEEMVSQILVEKHGVAEKLASLLARASLGRPGKAVSYKSDDFLKKRDKAIDGFTSGAAFDSDFDGLSKTDIRLYIEIMLGWYRDLLVAKAAGGPAAKYINIDRQEDILRESRRFSFEYLDGIIKQIILTSSFLDQNANPKIAMSVLALKALEGSER